MDCESRRELALKELEKARKHFEKISTILDREEEIFELETYYGTIGCYLDDLKHEIEDMQLFDKTKGIRKELNKNVKLQ